MFDLPEKCTIWNQSANDGFGGKTWDGPYIVPCRIAYVNQEFTDTNGDTFFSSAVVYSESEQFNVGSQVFLGESASPTPPPNSNDVRKLTRTPSGTNLRKGWFS